MAHIIAIVNHKGGVGKTTTVVNLAAALVKHSKKCLLIDLDPQANLTQTYGLLDADDTIYEALHGKTHLKPLNIKDDLDVIPSKLDLSGIEMELGGVAGREFLLKELLKPLSKKYDVVLLDCSPSFGLLTLNALTACERVIIPIQCQFLAVQGLAKLTEIVKNVKKRLNRKLFIFGVLFTHYDKRRVLDKDVIQVVQDNFKGKVFKTKIRANIALAEAPSQQKDVFTYDPKSHGAADYHQLYKEVIKNL